MDLLIDYGLVLANIALRGARHDEIVFQLPLIAVVDQVDAGIHFTVSDLRIGADVGPPLPGVVSNEVVDLSGKLAFSCQSRLGVGSGRLHAQDAGSPRAGGHAGWVES